MAERKQSDSSSLEAAPPYVVGYDAANAELNAADEKDKTSRDISPSHSIAGLDRVGKNIVGDELDEDAVIRTGADASKYLLSLRDDGDPIITFRSALLGTTFACFQAAMNQIYNVGTFELRRIYGS